MPVSERAFASVVVHRDAATILADWAWLEHEAPCSIYQTRAWLLPWIETLGRQAGITPLFALARDADDRPVALLCLGLTNFGPLTVARWLGGADANFAMPIMRPGPAWTRAETMRLLREISRVAGRGAPDAYLLQNQPFDWRGHRNPLALLRHQASPSAAYATALPIDADDLFRAKLSKDARKKLRKKEARLAAIGPVTHRLVATTDERARILDAFFAMRIARFRQQGLATQFETPAMRAFLEAASAPSGTGIALHALLVGDRVVAVYGGAAHDGQWSGMINAFEADVAIARSSPGDLLLMRVIRASCESGARRFDLGIGEARYKVVLCDETVPLFDAFVPVTVAGYGLARLMAARQSIKRRLKGDARLFALIKRMRARAVGADRIGRLRDFANQGRDRREDDDIARAGLDQFGLQPRDPRPVRPRHARQHHEVGIGRHDPGDVAVPGKPAPASR